MNNSNEHRQSYEDEISLVYLATIFVRRRRVFYWVFAGIVGIALIYALLIFAEVREYATLVKLAEQRTEDGAKPLEPPQLVIASIRNDWYPLLQADYFSAEKEKMPFEIAATNPEDTSLIKLSSEAPVEMADKVKAYQQALVDLITERQVVSVNREKSELEQRAVSLRKTLEELAETQAAGEAQAQLIQERTRLLSEIEKITARMASLRPAQTLAVARQSVESKGLSAALIVAMSVVLGLMLGVFAAFLAEFGHQVSQALKKGG